ncbi:NADP-specific glutamate dehydrogenase [Sphingosinicella ginsenosidimutans]|uniref:Glutamate dehydrogenase n=1 Tax=Allosphingosinicella ginsenosidimutans TaxID=1176539 RepID=A0A5C6TRG7_9SPHN|nr:NADP-specific glutamate dehydrogenase [Sphingosinicella ginsenosidimutans]TXC62780.1 NADP-specific glutamate dehydrogenase [Sphingosinicella ginsenosidimutans]
MNGGDSLIIEPIHTDSRESEHVDLAGFMEGVKRRNPGQTEFIQAVQEVAEDIFEFIEGKEDYHRWQILRRIAEPDRIVSFRVCWEDDNHNIRVQRGYRVQNNNAIGPYKGGLRFHPSVNESILKFLAFEQTFKNALTGLPMGGGKGGSNFNPKGKSDGEIMRFCQSFMTELYRHIGADVDVPAGDIGVGGREIGYMYGQYKRITGQFTGVLTGKGMEYGGSLIRPEATGYGAVYFLENMLKTKGQDLAGKRAVISGSGNVATHAAEKINQLGGKVLTLSDSEGFVHDPDGIDQEKINWVKAHKTRRRGRISEYADEFKNATFHAGQRPWGVECDVALPCATQNELLGEDARTLVRNGCIAVSEGANMPTDLDGVHVFKEAHLLYAPGKASNAGGVAVSGLEMSQNSERRSWRESELQQMLRDIMDGIHERCLEYGDRGGGYTDYVKGANIAGFKKVADAMLAFGVV